MDTSTRREVHGTVAMIPLVLGAFLVVLGASMVGTGVTRIRQSLDAPTDYMQYFTVGYNVVLGSSSP